MQHSKSRTPILFVTCILSLALHTWAIYLLNEVEVHINPATTLFHEEPIGRNNLSTWESKEHETLVRNEALATTFRRLKTKPVNIEDISLNITELKDTSVEIPATRSFELPKTSPVPVASSEPATLDHLQLQGKLKGENSLEAPLPTMKGLAVSYTQESEIQGELIQATSALLGEIQIDDSQELSKEPGLLIGVSGNATIEGTSLHNNTGFVLEGTQDTSKSGLPMMDKYNPTALSEGSSSKGAVSGNVGVHGQQAPLSPGELGIETGGSLQGVLSLGDLGTIASSQDFTLDIHYQKKRDGSGYLFRITLVPKEGVVFKRIRQNMFFLIDRSNSINRKRYDYAKQAVAKALDYMHPGDTFNILVFDDTLVSFSHVNLPWNNDNIARAKDFLKKQDHGGLFASTDLYSSLGNIVPDAVAETEVNTAILLSDGDTFLGREKQRKTIAGWTEENRGKVSLFSVASGAGNNLALLEIMSTFNRGSLSYVRQDKEIEKSLISLVHKIRNPIGKDISVTVITENPETKVTIFPTAQRLPDLYQGIPYTLVGSVNRLDDFRIFLQGRHYDKWLDIKQYVSFKEGQEGDSSIEREWIVHNAFEYYERYLKDGELANLRSAEKLLAPLHIPIAFE